MVWVQRNHVRGSKIAMRLHEYYSLYASQIFVADKMVYKVEILSGLRLIGITMLCKKS